MNIRVMYKDGAYATIRAFRLAYLLETNMVKKFYRNSEQQWVIVGEDPVRENGHSYPGLERRKNQIQRKKPTNP